MNEFTQKLWHFRLAHLNAKDMKAMATRKIVGGLEKVVVDGETKFCESCVEGKQTRQPFNRRNVKRSNRILEIIHSDVSGPMQTTAWNGNRYFVSFTDDYSRATQIYCIERKSEVLDKFKEFVEMAEARHGCKIAKLRADNGGEYSSNEFKLFCKEMFCVSVMIVQ